MASAALRSPIASSHLVVEVVVVVDVGVVVVVVVGRVVVVVVVLKVQNLQL